MKNARLLLKVEDVFDIKGRGLVLAPDISIDMLPQPHPRTVTLKFADETTHEVEAMFVRPTFNPPPQKMVGYLCELKQVEKMDVPIGTEVWIEV